LGEALHTIVGEMSRCFPLREICHREHLSRGDVTEVFLKSQFLIAKELNIPQFWTKYRITRENGYNM
jgi:hypothetical protein